MESGAVLSQAGEWRGGEIISGFVSTSTSNVNPASCVCAAADTTIAAPIKWNDFILDSVSASTSNVNPASCVCAAADTTIAAPIINEETKRERKFCLSLDQRSLPGLVYISSTRYLVFLKTLWYQVQYGSHYLVQLQVK